MDRFLFLEFRIGFGVSVSHSIALAASTRQTKAQVKMECFYFHRSSMMLCIYRRLPGMYLNAFVRMRVRSVHNAVRMYFIINCDRQTNSE